MGYKIKRILVGTQQVRPSVPATAITLNQSSISLTTAGQTSQLTATLTPSGSTSTVSWSSSNTSIATVSSSGLVTCVTPGSCTITATTSNGLTATCSVAGGWTPGANTLLYRPLTANANDKSGNGYNGTGRNVTYSSTNGAFISGTAPGIDFPSSFSPGTSFTYSIWTKRLSSQYDLLITNWVASYRYIYFRIKNTGEMTLFYGNGSTSQSEWNNIATVSDSVWHNIVLVKNGYDGTVYIDGVSKGTHTFTYNPSPQKVSGGQFCIGLTSVDTSSTTGVYYKDCIFESSLWTSSEVLNYYNLTKTNY